MQPHDPPAPRTIHMYDWSQASPENRHAAFCLAYRLLAKGETRRQVVAAVSEKLGISEGHASKLWKKYIRIEYHDQDEYFSRSCVKSS